ncbi:MAG: D-alanyl-D-alanine carboxypeptidase family protein, partial [Clostridia bacterium]|nr:D-alanyl-D-alanine carboxypeptidase family protein [Clostridia bacterium]
KQHAHEYGFIGRYKKGRDYITGYAYEPWHYRYVGTEAAKIIHDTNMTYEEYCAVYLYKSEYSLDKDRVWAKVLQVFHK